MNVKFKYLKPSENIRSILEALENAGFSIKVVGEKGQWEDPSEILLVDCTFNRFTFDLRLEKSEFEFKMPLETNTWYPRKDFDENPNNYSVIQFHNDEPSLFIGIPTKILGNSTTHFMYIERPEKSNEQLQP